ncbi:MAG: hypothetical protein J3R72DRAFT_448013 [Linnemannia gamsii]|nr:MAG: hypothetical protein J3R72DRAFT_448013 [Linnemannia gamsii]
MSETGDTKTQHQYPCAHGSPSQEISSTEVPPSPAFSAMTNERLHHTYTEEVDPRHVSFKVQPIHNTETQLTMHSLPQLAHSQTSSTPLDQVPPSSMLAWSFSPEQTPWMAQGGSPFPHRAYSDPSNQSTSDSHALVESDRSGGSSASSSFRRGHPPVTGGKVPRLSYGGKNLALLRPSCLSVVDTATTSDEHSSPPSVTMPDTKIPSIHGTSSTHRSSAYAGPSTISNATSESSTLSPLSDEFQSDMDVLVAHYNNRNDCRLREIMDERLPEIFVSCKEIVRSMESEEERAKLLMKHRGGIPSVENQGRTTAVESGTVHNFGRLPAREFRRRRVPAGWRTPGLKRDETPLQVTRDDGPSSSKDDVYMQDIKEEAKDIQGDGQSVYYNHDTMRTPSPEKQAHQDTKSPGSTSPYCQTPAVVSPSMKMSDSVSPLLKSVTLESPSSKALSLEQAPVAHANQELAGHTTSHQEIELKYSPQGRDDGQSSSSGESAGSGRKRKRDHMATSEHAEPTNANVALHLGTAHGDCAVLTTGVNAALATGINAGPRHVATSNPTSTSGGPLIMRKESTVGLSATTQNSSNLLINSAHTRAKMIRWDTEFTRAMQHFQECCVQIMICLQQPAQLSFNGHDGTTDSSPSKASTPMSRSDRSTEPTPITPLSMVNFQPTPLSVKIKLKGEVTKLIKGGNDIFAAIAKDYYERADLLSKIEACREITVDTRGNIDGLTNTMIIGRDNALAQLEQCLDLVDMRHTGRVRFGAMELHASCSGLYQMLQSVFA